MKRIVCWCLLLITLWPPQPAAGPPLPRPTGRSLPSPGSSAPTKPVAVGELAEDLPERVMTGGTGSRTPVILELEALAQFVAFLDGLEIAYPTRNILTWMISLPSG